jgi:hypothetical protein
MATSGATSFTLDIGEILDEAFERVGGEPVTGKEPLSARRSLNLLLTDWQNAGLNLWQLEAVTTAVATSVGQVTLDASTVDIVEGYLRRDSRDTPLARQSFSDFAAIPNKTQTGRPTKIFIDRQRDAPVINLWPLPENSTDELYLWRVRRLQDVNKSAGQHADVPFRFIPALTAGLAYYLSFKRKGVSPDKRAELRMEYERVMALAVSGDEDNVDMRIVPRLGGI